MIRSLYLSTDEIFSDNKGLEILYKTIYDLGSFEGYLTVAESFYESGHDGKAIEAFSKAKYKRLKLGPKRKSEEDYQELDNRYQKLEMMILKQK